MSEANDRSEQKVRKPFEQLQDKRSLLIVMQDNPDPDSLAAAAALRRVVRSFGEVQCSIAYGGVIGRGENRAMADYLGLNFRPIAEVDPRRFDVVALVDTQPGSGNNSLPAELTPHIVIDHHPLRPETRKVPFTDVRSKYGAVSTILVEYMTEAGVVPEPPLATSLLYAVRSDTQDLGQLAVQADVRAVEALFPLANTKMLSAIQRGAVTSEYFRDLSVALANARLYGSSILAELGEVGNPDMVAEVADLLLRHEAAIWVLCFGVYRETVWLSLRASSSGMKAGEVMRAIVAGIGTGGGHDMSAGGQVRLEAADGKRRIPRRKIRERFLRRTRQTGRAVKLVSVKRPAGPEGS